MPRPWATWCTLSAIATAHVLQLAGVDLGGLALQPAGFAPWQLASYGLVHASLGHLVGNGVVLASAGPTLEGRLGAGWWLAIALTGVVAGGLAQLAAAVPIVGASGAVYALLGAAWVVLPPAARLRGVAGACAVVGIAASAAGTGAGVATWAHAGGLVAGVALAAVAGRQKRRGVGWA